MTLPVLSLTGDAVFDFFFSLVLYPCLIAVVPGQIFKLLR